MPIHGGKSGAWSPDVEMGNVWLRQGGAWVPVLTMHVRDSLVGPSPDWRLAYEGAGTPPALVAPVGTTDTPIGEARCRLLVTNRFTSWRLRGTVSVFNGTTLVSTTPIDVRASEASTSIAGITSGSVRFEVRYFQPSTDADGPTAIFTHLIGMEG